MQVGYTGEQIAQWLVRCFGTQPITVVQIVKGQQRPGREQWRCQVRRGAEEVSVIVKVFKPSDSAAVNASLSPGATAHKCALAKQELRTWGLPTPRCFGFEAEHQTGMIIVEKLIAATWTSATRIQAAQHLANLHQLRLESLSVTLQSLVQCSDARPQRTYLWLRENLAKVEALQPTWQISYPALADTAHELLDTPSVTSGQVGLVHGDYFSANVFATDVGIRVIDWETFALGDPMWDLAFLIGADRNLAQTEVDRVIAAYGAIAPVALPSLLWHKRCWDTAWALQDLVKQFSVEQNVQTQQSGE